MFGGGLIARPLAGPAADGIRSVANLKTAKALCLTVSPLLMATADEIIE
jgi:hypothetical protein